MERLKQITLLFCLFILLNLTSVNYAWAQDNQSTTQSESKLQLQLIEISQQNDKSLVINELSGLLKSKKFTGIDKAEILFQKAKTFFAMHKYSQGIDVIHQVIAIADVHNQPRLIAKANHMLGILYYYQGELQLALQAYQASFNFYDTNQVQGPNNFALERANALNNIALVYTSLGKSSLALVNYQLAEPLYSQYGTEADKIDVRYNIAALYLSLRRFDKAVDILENVIHKRQLLNDEHGVATAKADLGIALKHSSEYILAKENIASALVYFEKNGFKHDVASQLHNMAEIHNDMFDAERAIYYGKQALIVSEDVGHQKAYAGSLQSLAKAAFLSGELAKAEHYLQRSNELANKIDYQILLTENLAISSLLSAGHQRFQEALNEQKHYETSYQFNVNNLLNDKLAEFESEQLNQKILDLEQRRKLQLLESARVEQQRNLVILTLVLILGVIFYIYRRHLEKRVTQELELRVKLRTRELEELTEELAKADQVKSQFLANMSHEIRTPLTAIVGHSEAIIYDEVGLEEEQEKYQEKVKSDIEVIHGNSLHLLELINDILDLSRIEANKFELEKQPSDLGELIQDLADTFKSAAYKKQLNFRIEYQLSFPFIIEIDSLRLKQILLNLCSNAIKFTEEGEVTLKVEWQNEQLTFTVTDTGIGLNQEHLAQIFEVFTQADNSISRRFGGSGLGLTLSKQLAKLMSGDITATSVLGEGSTFCLTLPCSIADSSKIKAINDINQQELEAKQINEPGNENKGQLYQGKVLLAEDHDDNRQLIARLLSSLGLEVSVAKNGREAVQHCIEHKPELILLDIQMPEMDGVEAFKVLRDLGCDMPIYALTANAMSHEVSEYLSIGFTGHLKKPIERKHFIAAITKHFPNSKAQPQQTNSLSNTKEVADEAIMTNEEDILREAEDELSAVDLSDLIEEFQKNLVQDKEKIMLYSNNNDIQALSQIAHQLSGAAQMFGFVELNQAAKELEQAIKHEALADHPNHSLISDLTHCLADEINLVERQ